MGKFVNTNQFRDEIVGTLSQSQLKRERKLFLNLNLDFKIILVEMTPGAFRPLNILCNAIFESHKITAQHIPQIFIVLHDRKTVNQNLIWFFIVFDSISFKSYRGLRIISDRHFVCWSCSSFRFVELI